MVRSSPSALNPQELSPSLIRYCLKARSVFLLMTIGASSVGWVDLLEKERLLLNVGTCRVLCGCSLCRTTSCLFGSDAETEREPGEKKKESYSLVVVAGLADNPDAPGAIKNLC